jgi:nucleoside-diphosphate-sugar epimerase
MVRHVLVTGAGGYIGSVLSAALIDQGNTVTAVNRYFFGEETISPLLPSNRLSIVRDDIRDLSPKMFEGVDAVFDLAALSNDPAGDLEPALTESINNKGRAHVARCAKAAGVKHYVLSSSCSVYGHGERRALDERSKPSPITTYARANLRAEEETLALGDEHFICSVLRNATVFGLSPRMRFDLVVNLMTLNAVQKGKIFVLGGGHQWRPLIHVRDVAQAFLAVLNADPEKVKGQIFNIGLDNYQVLTVAYMVRETLPFRIDIEIAPDDADKRDYNVSFDKIKTKLGFGAKVTIPEGIHEVYEALKMGVVSATPETVTVGWYRSIIEAEKLIRRVKLNDRLI